MPAEATPRILDRLSLRSLPECASSSDAPSSAKAIFCPCATLGAPQTTVWGASPP